MNEMIQADRRLLATPRIVLREHRIEDLEPFCELQTDPEVARYVAWLPRTRAQCEAALIDAIDQQSVAGRARRQSRAPRGVLPAAQSRLGPVAERCGFCWPRETAERVHFFIDLDGALVDPA